MATGFAFAVDSPTFTGAQVGVGFDGNRSGVDLTVTRDGVPGAVAPAANPAVAAPAPAPKKPTLLESAQKFVGDNESQIAFGLTIGFLAFLIIGTGGAALAFGLAGFGMAMFIK